jgi:subtilisin family serine protease
MDQARQLSQQLGEYGLRAKQRKKLKYLGLVISTFRAPAEIDLPQTAINIRVAYPQMWADLNHRYTLLGNDRNALAAQNIIKWNRNKSSCGKGLRIGLIDTEINTSHAALQNQKIVTRSLVTNGVNTANADHGTAIAALLVGSHKSESFSGLLPSAELFAASVFRQRDPTNIDTTSEWVVSAIDWLISQRVHVINMSIGGPRNLLVEAAIQRTIKSGIPVIAAVGNGGANAEPVFPAAQQGVIAVTAVDNELALYEKANQGDYIDFAAPGVDTWTASANGGGKSVSGTSFAAPFVTANIASLLKIYGPEKYYTQLQKTVNDLSPTGKDNKFGWGLVQATDPCT